MVCAAAAVLTFQLSSAQPPPAEAPGRLWVRLTDEQGRPIAARVYLTGPDKAPLIPAASIARQARTGEFYFHAGVAFQVQAPPGRVTIEAVNLNPADRV